MTTVRNKRRNNFLRLVFLLVFVSIFAFNSCKPDLSDDAIPYQAFGTVYLNLSLPQFQKLRTQGYDYYNDVGVRGLILYKESATSYIAYERNCSYHPNEACATVDIHISGLYMEDPCCGSVFQFATGMPTSGVAWRPLRKYFTSLSGSELTITDEIIK